MAGRIAAESCTNTWHNVTMRECTVQGATLAIERELTPVLAAGGNRDTWLTQLGVWQGVAIALGGTNEAFQASIQPTW